MDSPLIGAAILFDLDGTLIDTAPDLIRALNVVLAEAELPRVGAEHVRNLVGHGARALIERGAGLHGVRFDAHRLQSMVERFLEVYRSDIAADSRLYPGVEDALRALQGEGARLAVCTNKPQALTEPLLRSFDLAKYFSVIAGPEMVTQRKPHPAHLLEPLEKLGVSRRRAVMIGDSAPDIGAARAAEIPVILVDFGYSQEPVADLGPDAVLSQFKALPKLAAKLLSRA